MRLKKLKLQNFRNYQQLELSFPEDKNLFLIIGANAQGKTNLIEGIYLLALAKAFRSNHLITVQQWETDYFSLQGQVERGGVSQSLDLIHQLNPKLKKAHKINGVKKVVTDFVGNLLVTLFTPDDLNLVYLSPALRRRYFDVVLSQTSKIYLQNILKYKKVLKNRNSLLKQINASKSQDEELFFWDEKLSEIGLQIISERLKLVDYYNQHLTRHYQHIADEDSSLKIDYKSNLRGLNHGQVQKELGRRLNRDIQCESTSLGPHRDDILFYLNNRPMMEFASRGEIRSAVLALKITEIDFFKDQTGFKPVLLLDDAFSELDPDRQKLLLDLVNKHQTIVTTTPEYQSIFKGVEKSMIWKCVEGKLID